VRNGFFKFSLVLRKNRGFGFGSVLKIPSVQFGFLCRSVVKYKKKRVSCFSCVCILHFVFWSTAAAWLDS